MGAPLRFGIGLLPVGLVLCCPIAGAARPSMMLAPMTSQHGEIDYPRLRAFPNATIKRRVNGLLAEAEAADRNQRLDCLEMVRQSGQKSSAGSYGEKIAVTYLSPHYISIDVRKSYFCATAYPTLDSSEPLTVDLTAGARVNWARIFKPGFLSSDAAVPPLGALYRNRYTKSGRSADCKQLIATDNPFSQGAILRLDAARGGLVVQPDFPHVVAACAAEFVFSPDELAPYVADAGFLRDLRNTSSRPKR